MGRYQINYIMKFTSRPTKAMVENKLFDLLRDELKLMSIENTDDLVRKKVKKKRRYEKKSLG